MTETINNSHRGLSQSVKGKYDMKWIAELNHQTLYIKMTKEFQFIFIYFSVNLSTPVQCANGGKISMLGVNPNV